MSTGKGRKRGAGPQTYGATNSAPGRIVPAKEVGMQTVLVLPGMRPASHEEADLIPPVQFGHEFPNLSAL